MRKLSILLVLLTLSFNVAYSKQIEDVVEKRLEVVFTDVKAIQLIHGKTANYYGLVAHDKKGMRVIFVPDSFSTQKEGKGGQGLAVQKKVLEQFVNDKAHLKVTGKVSQAKDIDPPMNAESKHLEADTFRLVPIVATNTYDKEGNVIKSKNDFLEIKE